MTSKLELFNGALGTFLGERMLASLSENREPRRLLDGAWDRGAVDYCLGQGQWKFAKRTSKLEYNLSMDSSFGFSRTFEQPEDFIRTICVSSDEYFSVPLLDYAPEGGFFFADIDNIYLSYVSNDSYYGGDFSIWPETFCRYVECYLAWSICERLTQSASKLDYLEKKMHKLLVDSRSKDAMELPTKMLPQGNWVSSRSRSRSREGGQ